MRTYSAIMILWILCVLGCGEVSKTVIYNDRTYPEVSKAENIRIKHIDGKEFMFYKMEIISVDENFIYARCWERKKSDAVDYKFNKKEVIIESTSFSANKAVNYVFLTAVSVGILLLLTFLLSRQ